MRFYTLLANATRLNNTKKFNKMDNNFLQLWDKLHPKEYKDGVKDFLSQKENILHEIKDYTVLNIKGNIILVNKQSYKMECFETKESAINKALDFYKSGTNKQTTIL